MSSTSFSSTSSSSSTSTTLPPSIWTFSYQDTATSSQTFTQGFGATGAWKCPAGVTTVKVECWGGGGGGGGASATVGAGGGGGGGYSRLNALAVTAGTVYTVTVGAAGAGGAAGANGTAGTDSWFSTSGTVIAKGGGLGPANSGSGGAGGAAGSGIGDATFSGGNGGNTAVATGGAGGGSSAGSISNGNNGGDATAGGNVGGAKVYAGGRGGTGGASGTTPAGDGSSGGVYGGGGGGGGSGGSANSLGGGGASGAVVLTWTTSQVGLPTGNANLLNAFTNPQYANVAVDDGDYFIEYGSEYMIQEYKFKHNNSTDNIMITWRGRSTKDPRTSPILLQIFNQDSLLWETLAQESRVAADTDLVLSGTQTTNVSSYYNPSNFRVTVRVYQVI